MAELTLEEVKAQLQYFEKENKLLKTFVAECNSKIEELESSLSTYENFLSVDDFPRVSEVLENYAEWTSKVPAEKMSEKLKDIKVIESLGDVSLLKEKLNTLEAYEEQASIAEIEKATEILEEYSKLGTPSEVENATVILEKYTEFGDIATLEKATNILEEYSKLGTPQALNETLNAFSDLGYTVESARRELDKKIQEAHERDINELTSTYNITVEGAESSLAMNKGDLILTKAYLEKLNLRPSTPSLVGKKVLVTSESKVKKTDEKVSNKKVFTKTFLGKL